jgi:hypothetical protein
MTEAFDAEALLFSLRRKEGNWVQWGQKCQQLQEQRIDPQVIFEATGFEPSRQNQFIVSSQVFGSLEKATAAAEVLAHFERSGSNVLYELRVLTGPERVEAATFIQAKGLDVDRTHELVRAMKGYSPPPGFTKHPGDALAYRCWKLAKQTEDIRERSRLIAQGLSSAYSETARKEIEALLMQMAESPKARAPRLPTYRLEDGEELPRVFPVLGRLPIPVDVVEAAPTIEESGPFRVAAGSGASWVALPGWQVIQKAVDPVVILATTADLGLEGRLEEVLVVVDRKQQIWDQEAYFLTASGVQWFAEEAETALLGQVILILRARIILDEELVKDPWQTDE